MQPALALFPLAGHHHAVDIGQRGLEDHAADRIMNRLHVQVAGADHHQVGLLAGCQGADAVELTQHARAFDRDPGQGLAGGDGRGRRDGAMGGAVRHIVERALHAQGDAGLAEHVAAEHTFEVCTQRGGPAKATQPPGQRMAMALRHFVFSRRRKAHAQLTEAAQLLIVERMAMHDVHMLAQQALLLKHLPAFGRAGRPAALVQRGDDAQIARHGKVMQCHVQGGVMRPQHRGMDGQQRLALVAFEQALDLSARVRHLPEGLFTRLGVRLGRAVEEGRTDASLKQAFDGCIVVRRRRVVVAPVDQGGGAAVDLVERAHQGGDVQIFGLKHRGQARMHLGEVFQQRPVGSQSPQRRLPGVHMGIDQPGNDDLPAGIDLLSRIGMDARRDLGDAIALHQNVRTGQIALAVHGDDGGAADQRLAHGLRTTGRRSWSRSRA